MASRNSAKKGEDSQNTSRGITFLVLLFSVGVYAGIFKVVLNKVHTVDGLLISYAVSIFSTLLLLGVASFLDKEKTKKNLSEAGSIVMSFLISEVAVFLFQISPSMTASKINTSSDFILIPVTLRGQYNGTAIMLAGNAKLNLSEIVNALAKQSELTNIVSLIVLILFNMGFFAYSVYLVIEAWESRKNKERVHT